MAQGVATSPATILQTLEAAAIMSDSPHAAIARAVGLNDESMVRRLFARYEPVAAMLADVKSGWLVGMWQSVLVGTLARLHQLSHVGGNPGDSGVHVSAEARNWSVVAGIATERLMLVAGRPTAILAQVHDVRLSLPQLAERLARVAAALEPHTTDGTSVPLPDDGK